MTNGPSGLKVSNQSLIPLVQPGLSPWAGLPPSPWSHPPALPHQVGPLSLAAQHGPGQVISELQTLMSSPAKHTVLKVWLSPCLWLLPEPPSGSSVLVLTCQGSSLL